MTEENVYTFVRSGFVEGFRKGRGSYELVSGYRLRDPQTGKLLDPPMSWRSCQEMAKRDNKEARFE